MRSLRDFDLGVAAVFILCILCVWCGGGGVDHLIISHAIMLVFSLLSPVLGSLCKQDREVDTRLLS